MSGDVYIWSGNSLSRVVKNVHSGPVFAMFTTVKDGLIVTGGKDKGYERVIMQYAKLVLFYNCNLKMFLFCFVAKWTLECTVAKCKHIS